MEEKDKKNWKATKKYKSIKESLLMELKKNGNTQPFFISLVEDYCELWVVKQMLLEDITENGVYIFYQNGATQKGRTKNSSVQEVTKISQQMLKILTQLKIEVKVIEEVKEDEDFDEL